MALRTEVSFRYGRRGRDRPRSLLPRRKRKAPGRRAILSTAGVSAGAFSFYVRRRILKKRAGRDAGGTRAYLLRRFPSRLIQRSNFLQLPSLHIINKSTHRNILWN